MTEINDLSIEILALEEECVEILNNTDLTESERKSLLEIKLDLIRQKATAIKLLSAQ